MNARSKMPLSGRSRRYFVARIGQADAILRLFSATILCAAFACAVGAERHVRCWSPASGLRSVIRERAVLGIESSLVGSTPSGGTDARRSRTRGGREDSVLARARRPAFFSRSASDWVMPCTFAAKAPKKRYGSRTAHRLCRQTDAITSDDYPCAHRRRGRRWNARIGSVFETPEGEPGGRLCRRW